GERTAARYRLPTEAEWEYCCRAGTTTPFHFGDYGEAHLTAASAPCTYRDGRKGVSGREYTAVGSFPPNAWGLFDLHGNVCEWCSDWHSPYEEGEVTDPRASVGGTRISRGGGWGHYPRMGRSATRLPAFPPRN